jgi:hypothetical protein
VHNEAGNGAAGGATDPAVVSAFAGSGQPLARREPRLVAAPSPRDAFGEVLVLARVRPGDRRVVSDSLPRVIGREARVLVQPTRPLPLTKTLRAWGVSR